MVLRDWLIQNNTDTLATIATGATMGSSSDKSVANVAIVAVGGTEIIEKQSHTSLKLQDLIALHPPIIDGYKLSDILNYAVEEDYEDLLNPNVLSIFARALSDGGKLKGIERILKSKE